MEFDAKIPHSRTEYLIFVSWLVDTTVMSLSNAKGNPALVKSTIEQYIANGYAANLTSAELTDFFCVNTPSIVENAGYHGIEADEIDNKSHRSLETLSRLALTKRGVYLKLPCDESTLQDLRIALRRCAGERLSVELIRLYEISNGCQINCAYFHDAAHIINELNHRGRGMVGFGDDETAYFVFDPNDDEFHIILEGDDGKFKSFDSFERLLLTVMKEQGVI